MSKFFAFEIKTVKTNRETSNMFAIHKGLKQGRYLLFPLVMDDRKIPTKEKNKIQ